MISLDTLESLRDFDTALLANTLEYISTVPAHDFYMGGSIHSWTPDIGPVVGLAQTCKIDTSSPGGGNEMDLYFEQLDRIHALPVPTIWVVETVGSRPEHECVTGDGMAKTLFAAGCLGVITNGYCRDLIGCQSVPFAVHCRGTIAHHGAIRVKQTATPVEIGGLTVASMDIIHADREGIIKIPPESAQTLVDRAPQMRAFEHDAHVIMRRTDISPTEKRTRVDELLRVRYGFDAGSHRCQQS